MVDSTVLHRRWHVWPSPAFVLDGLRPRQARPPAPAEKRHTAAQSTI
jgi:hypothetical protein